MKPYLPILFLLTFNTCFSQTKLDTLITQFQQADLTEVINAKNSIVNYQEEAIPVLIEMLKDTSYVKLENTADLIYPGTEKFYGHGWSISYDIDWIAVRAAWLLEELTFQDFGYSQPAFDFSKINYINLGKDTLGLQNYSKVVDTIEPPTRAELITKRLMLADSVSQWWEKNKATWTRFSALKTALASTDKRSQKLALAYLRFGNTICEGLTLESYKTELEPLVKAIKNSNNTNADQAKYLLEDKEFYWLKVRKNMH